MKRMILLALSLIVALTASAAVLQRQQQRLSSKMIRLHVVANSNSDDDQILKIKVRDEILKLTDNWNESDIPENLHTLKAAAENCLIENDCSDNVTVTYCSERFPTRLYDTFSLPAGVYRTIRISIGEGQGDNWWCVVFPAICMSASMEEFETAAVFAGFTESEYRLITKNGGEYILKFKLIEWINTVKERVFN